LYREILEGRGFGIADARPSINLAYQARNAQPVGKNDYSHPFLLGEPFALAGLSEPINREGLLAGSPLM
jgi:hypothetical protein